MTAHYLAFTTFPSKTRRHSLDPGSGGVGLLLVQMAHHLGARVIGTASTEEKAKLAREAGADEVILYTQVDFGKRDQTPDPGQRRGRRFYDSVGKTTFEKGLNLLRPRGMMVLFGGSSGAVPPFDPIVTQPKRFVVSNPALAEPLHCFTRGDLEARAGGGIFLR